MGIVVLLLWKASHVKVCTSTCKRKQIEDKCVVNPAQSDEKVDIVLISVRNQQSPDLTRQKWSVIGWRMKAG